MPEPIQQNNNAGAAGAGAGAGTGAAAAGAAAAGTGAAWYGDIPADKGEFKTWVETKQYANPLSALEGHFNAEKLLGAPADQIIRLPKAEDKAGWDAVYNRLGRPEKPEGYELPLPAGDDGKLATQAASWFHAAGVPKAAAQSIAKQWNEHIGNLVTQQQQAQEATATQALDALKTEWGADYEKRAEFGRRGLKAYGEKAGLDANDLGALEKAIGTSKMLKLFHTLGETTGEHDFTGGDGGNQFGMTPAQAKVKLDALRQQRIEGKIGDKDFFAQSEALGKVANPGNLTGA